MTGTPVLAAPKVVHGEVELGGGEEEVHSLRGAEQRHHLVHHLEPQRVRHLQHLPHPLRLHLHLVVHRPSFHPASARELHHRRRQRFLCARGGVLNHALPPDGAVLQLVGGLELRAAEVVEVFLEDSAVEEDGELVLELHPGLGVQQLERRGGAPPAASEVEVLGGGGPGRGEHAEHVVVLGGGEHWRHEYFPAYAWEYFGP